MKTTPSLSSSSLLPSFLPFFSSFPSLSLSPLSIPPPLLDVPQWLKSLRLHKYQYLFADLTYEEMLQMKENYLEEKVGTLAGTPPGVYFNIQYTVHLNMFLW